MRQQIFELLEGWLRHKSDMVNFEAARVICEMKGVTPAQLTKSISGMSMHISTWALLTDAIFSASALPVFAQTSP